MIVLLAALLAAVLAWVFNGFVVIRWGDAAVAVLVPVAEETLKTFLPILLGASIFYTHFSFGVVEALWDMKASPRGFKPAVFSLITHSIFGAVTTYIIWYTGFSVLGIMGGSIIHIIWNSYIIKISER